MIPEETKRNIIDTARVEEVVGDFVTLKRRGSDLWACCPFHNEKTPSFHVVPSKGIYKCFSCGKSGTAVGFLMDYEHLTYVEALRYLARKYHIEVVEKEETAEDVERRLRGESLYLVSDFARKFFVESLSTKEGRSVGYQYFRSRGLEDSTIEKFSLGWAPKSRHELCDAALKEGYKPEYLVDTGLAVQRDDGTLSDRFFDRVIFPIHSVSGRVIAFGGRTLLTDKSVAKYVNSKESEIYVKSRSLYGIYQAKSEISKAGCCYLVEGYLDVLSMHQLGITNTVASSGTSLTEDQIRLIKRFTTDITIMYDGDSAGIHAALRGINMILREGMNVKTVLLPDGDDPDSYCRKHTLEDVRSFIRDNEQDFISFKTDLLLSEAGNDPLKKANLINDIADTIADIPDAVKRAVYANSCANRFDIDADIIFERIRSTREKVLSERRPIPSRDAGVQPSGKETTSPQEERYTPMTDGLYALETDHALAASEKELLGFILTSGDSPLAFETDSPYYDPLDQQRTVAEFIDAALSADNMVFVNEPYRKTYDEYFRLYDKGLEQNRILRELLDGEDRTTAYVAGELSEQKYMLTVKSFTNSLAAPQAWLAAFVPKSIMAYQEKRMEAEIQALTKELSSSSDPSTQRGIMEQMQRIYQVRQKLKVRLGRDRDK